MACSGSCCRPQTSAAPNDSYDDQEQPPATDNVTALPAPACDSSDFSCDTQTFSCTKNDCCPPNQDRPLQPESCCLNGESATACVDADYAKLQKMPSRSTTSCCPKSSSNAECYGAEKASGPTINTLELFPESHSCKDAEKGSAGTEHVVLSISGMTCTGCEVKLQRTLATLPYLSQLRTSLVLARAEFNIANGAATVEDVIKHLMRTTEFKCEQVSLQGSSLDVICVGKSSTLANGIWPRGVIAMQPLDEDALRVDFDSSVIGARDLIETGWDDVMQLAPIRPDSSLYTGRKHVWQMGLTSLLSAFLTIPVLVMAWAPLPDHETAYSSASLALATIVQVCIAGPFYPKALKALIYSRIIEMDLLIVLSTSAAYVFSVVSFGYLIAGNPLSTGQFFETSTLLVTLIMVGRWVASLARQKAAESISIRSLQTPTAILIDHNGEDKIIDARLLQYGDIFKVVPDSQVPTDGTVIEGSSEINESMLTGESEAIAKTVGSSVIAGSINGSGMLTVRLTRLPGDNTITTIAAMVDEAKLSKPRIQDIADRVASFFVPVVVMLTIITFVVWIAVGIAFRAQSGSEATVEAITYAVTVLIVSCPCAIGLAVPMVIVIASGVAAQHGVVFKSAESIEVAHKTTDVVFDKTGTLTVGKLRVVEELTFHPDPTLSTSLILGLFSNIKHPVSVAIASYLIEGNVAATDIQNTKVVTGNGVQGTWKGTLLRAGNASWLGLEAHQDVRQLLSKGLTVTCFTIDANIVTIYGLQDTLRLDAKSTIAELQRRHVAVHLLSGDDDGAVQSTASELSIPSSHVRSRCTPADKRRYVEALQAPQQDLERPYKPVVVFVGDGTNDAVALAQATVGVHMSNGTDIAQAAADVVLMRSDLSAILTLLAISKKAMHRITFNFGWSFVYNILAVLLGAGAFVNVRIPPEFAGLGELVSVLPVITAAVLLRWSKI